MKLLYIDCSMGAAGDMLAGALFDLLPECEQADLLHVLNDNLSGLAEASLMRDEKGGITGSHFHVLVKGREEGYEHHHEHGGDHGHDDGRRHGHPHEHRSLADILRIIDSFTFSETVKQEIQDVYTLIANAESRVHGKPVGEIHFHEVGAMDAIADISAVCLAMDALKIDRITASAVVTGFGTVRCAHGLLPVPAPATAELLTSLPTSAGDIEGELCTPTGAALVRHFADSFGTRPDMVLRGTGRGLGTRNFSRPNILQVFLGDGEVSLQTGTSVRESAAARPDTAAPSLTDTVVELACNLDDMTGEEIGFAAETLLEKGALDVWMQSIQMKKFRPGTLLSVLCRPEEEDRFVRLLFKYTTTLGVRRTLHERYILTREESDVTVQTEKADTRRGTAREETAADGAITMRKKTSRGYGVIRSKYEYDDLAEIAWATGQTLREVRDSL